MKLTKQITKSIFYDTFFKTYDLFYYEIILILNVTDNLMIWSGIKIISIYN